MTKQCVILILLIFLAIAGASSRTASAEVTVVAFGDSTTAPRMVDGEPLRVYADILRDELPDYGVAANVINSGVGGNTTNDALARFNSTVRAYDPDTVIIQFGINDAAVDVWKNPPATEPRVPLATYQNNLTTMVETLKADGAQPILMTPNPMGWTDQLLALYGKPPYDPNDPLGFNTVLVDYAQAVRDVAAAESVKLVDVYSLFLSYHAAEGQALGDLLLDGMHPNACGHRIVANGLISTMVVPNFTRDLQLYSSMNNVAAGVVPDDYGDNAGTICGTGVMQITDPTRGEVLDIPLSADDYVSYGDILDPASGSYTVAFWFKVTGTGTSQLLASKGANTSSRSEGWSVSVNSAGLVSLSGCYDDGNNDARVYLSKEGGPFGQWHHVALVIDRASGLFKGYLDGVSSGTTGTDNGWYSLVDNVVIPDGVDFETSQELALGYCERGVYPMDGQLDDFAVWSRALTDPEIFSLYHGARILPIPGDANGDDKVDEADAGILAGNWGTSVPGGAADGDFDGDGTVGPSDAAILAANWGYDANAEATSTVPEPGAWLLVVSGLAVFCTFPTSLVVPRRT